jgi:hypothetical protein
MKIKNYTPHSITLANGKLRETFKSMGSIRLRQKKVEVIGELNGFPVNPPPVFEGLEGVPSELYDEKKEEEGILVSMPVGTYLRENPKDVPPNTRVYGPDTSPENVARGPEGEILGSKAFIQYV